MAVARVDHAMTPEAVTGRDTECQALARAVQWHSENRVLLEGKRTVVFR
jgi:formyltetrahydrofolate deformylase